MTRNILMLALAAGVLSGCGVFNELDEHGREKNAAMLQSKVSLSDAIAIAEKQAGGKAIRAGVDEEDGAVLIKVSIEQNTKVQRVFIDPQTGMIVKTRSDEDGD